MTFYYILIAVSLIGLVVVGAYGVASAAEEVAKDKEMRRPKEKEDLTLRFNSTMSLDEMSKTVNNLLKQDKRKPRKRHAQHIYIVR